MASKKIAAKAAAKSVDTEDTGAGYDKVAKKSWGNIKKEQMLPEGTWALKVRGSKKMPATEKASAKLLVFFTPTRPFDDVDADALAELGEDYDVSTNSALGQFWLSEARDYAAVADFFEKCGIDVEELQEADVDFDESLKQLKGREVAGYLKVDTYNPDRPQMVASAFSKLDDVE